MTTKFLRLNPTAERVGWGPKHTMRIATEPEYEHLGFPKPVRVGKNTIAFVESEVEDWLRARVAERDEQGFEPKSSPSAGNWISAATAAAGYRSPRLRTRRA